MILEAMAAGVQHFGENRVEEAVTKIAAIHATLTVNADERPIWHLIGHLQSRKAKDVFDPQGALFDLVHSVDSVKLAGKLSKLAEEHHTKLDILLEMNVSGEASKEGFNAAHWSTDSAIKAQLWSDFSAIRAMPGLTINGLMTIAPIVDEMEMARPVFAELRRLRDALAESFGAVLPELSMGMTDDYPIAIEEGATLVRIGRAIFGER
jgi:pyridoxal phosphate enzyme (YggS family)